MGIKMEISNHSPKTEVRESAIEGRGIFAIEKIEKGEVVTIKGGHIFDRQKLSELEKNLGSAEIQISEDLFIGPVTKEEREGAMLFLNHSCDPNVGVKGQIIFVAMRDIQPGEEITHDWAMTDDDDATKMKCNCGSTKCRGVITGKDWKNKDLQKRYKGYMSWYIEEKIRDEKHNVQQINAPDA
jgi:SET domain-containing protein